MTLIITENNTTDKKNDFNVLSYNQILEFLSTEIPRVTITTIKCTILKENSFESDNSN